MWRAPSTIEDASLPPLRPAKVVPCCLLMIFASQCQSLPSRSAAAFFLIKRNYLFQPINFMLADSWLFALTASRGAVRQEGEGGLEEGGLGDGAAVKYGAAISMISHRPG